MRTMTRVRRLAVTGLVIVLATGGLVFSFGAAAEAADSCGSGWHKQSDGAFGTSRQVTSHGRTLTAKVGGYVRYCTRERRAKPDQRNQRVLIGVPKQIANTGKVAGAHSKVCVTQDIVVHISPWVSSASVGMSGTTPGASVTIQSGTARQRYTACAGAGTSKVVIPQRTMVVTAPNGVCNYLALGWAAACYAGPFVTKVDITTTTRATFKIGRTQYNPSVSQTETDDS